MTTQIWLMISNTNKILLNNKMQEKYRIIKVKSLAYFKRYACIYYYICNVKSKQKLKNVTISIYEIRILCTQVTKLFQNIILTVNY